MTHGVDWHHLTTLLHHVVAALLNWRHWLPILFNWAEIAFTLGGIILIHEFGHFIVAKWAGMEVDEFAIGIGPAIARWERGGTHYRLAPLLIMGYVKIRGLEGESDSDVMPGSFYSRPHGARLAVMVGGAMLNLITAALMFCVLYGVWGEVDIPAVIDKISPGTAAEQAGLQPGWRIASIDGRPTPTHSEVETAVRRSDGHTLSVALVDAGGETRTVAVTPRQDPALHRWLMGVVFRDDGGYTTTVGAVTGGGPAARAGLKRGDRIVSVDGKSVTQPDDVLDALANLPPELAGAATNGVQLPPLALVVERGGQTLSLTLTPQPRREVREKPPAPGEVVDPNADRPVESYLIGDGGFQLERRFHRLGLGAAIKTGFQSAWHMIEGVLDQLLTLLHGKGFGQVGGPVMIVRTLAVAADSGFYELLIWAARLSVMIGMMNLVPLPALDGGRVLFILIDWLCIRIGWRELDRRVEAWVHATGLLVLLVLMVCVSFRDVRLLR
jgi:regulator of sigma E protease